MPITINDCIECGNRPWILPIAEDGIGYLLLRCSNINCFNQSFENEDGDRAIETWNDSNPRFIDAD